MDINFLEEMANFVFTSKYARYRPDLKRRETWEEASNRVEEMHLKKFSHLSDDLKQEIKNAFNLVRQKIVCPSMRSMQFGGKAIETKNERIFNCSVRHLDSIRSFTEVMYLLLNGCGVGIGLYKKFLNRLPDLVSAEDKTGTVITYVVEDTIEGWSDSVEALLNCYFKNTAYTGRKICFDYSKIRRKGTPLKTSGGKAPGYKGLKQAHIKIKKLLDFIIEDLHQNRLKSINAYDIVMHCADAVLSGGVRRSAVCSLFDKDDNEMMNAKIGDWGKENPQRARSNNSVLLVREETTLEEFKNIIEKTKQWGEPGFVFGVRDQLFNPCQPAWAKILTPNGIKELKDVFVGDVIWSNEGWTKIIKKWSTGIKNVYEYRTTAGCFYGTENHKLVSNGVKIEAKDCESIDIFCGPYFNQNLKLFNQDIMDGLVIGDGSVHEASNNLVHLCIGKDDYDYFDSEIKDLIIKHRPGLHDYAYEIQTSIIPKELPKTYDRIIPDRFYYGNREKIYGFLRGLYSANGSICGNRITLKSSSFKLIEQVQTMLSSIGIKSYYTTNKPSCVKFSNGSYICKESYDLNISTDRLLFYKSIGFIQKYKNEKLINLVKNDKQKTGKLNYEIIEVSNISNEEVFDITVDNNSHTYWTQGCNVSNCFEIGFIPVTKDGICGAQFCNLTTINGQKIKTEEDFYKAVEAETVIGTLQATYTNFPYLGHVAEELTKNESLLGCSITAIMSNKDILLNPQYQRKAAKIAIETNKKWAKILEINQAARITCLKPEGTGTKALGSTLSGIHGAHAHKQFLRIQSNKEDNIFKFFKLYNPDHCEESVWCANKTDEVITFPITNPKGCINKSDLSAIEHLEIIKSTQQNWVLPGTTENNKIDVAHNVSCTVIVKPDEWDKVVEYIYKNKNYFAAVSFIPHDGDTKYPQAPNQSVNTDEEKKLFKKLEETYQNVDYTKLIENQDETHLIETYSCVGGKCDIL